MRLSFYDLLLFLLLFVFVAAFPVDLIPVDLTYHLLIQIGLRALLLTYYIYLIIKHKIKVFGTGNWRNILFCVPFLLVSVSNIIATAIDGKFVGISLSPIDMVLYTVLTLFVAVSEEIIFRLFIHSSLYRTSSIKRIFGSAGIFALMHLLNLVNVSTVPALVSVLIQTVYTFGLGILLGFLFEYGHSLLSCIFLHFAFNFFNTTLYEYLGGTCSDLSFYLTALVIGVVLAIYVFLLNMFYFSRLEKYYKA